MLCLVAGAVSAVIALDAFTLAWTHSIEKLRWEEDWRIVDHMLVLDEARIRGTGAGMEAPAGARLANGVWHYRPHLPPQAALRLAHSAHTAGHEICFPGCVLLAGRLPGLAAEGVIEISPCQRRHAEDSAQGA